MRQVEQQQSPAEPSSSQSNSSATATTSQAGGATIRRVAVVDFTHMACSSDGMIRVVQSFPCSVPCFDMAHHDDEDWTFFDPAHVRPVSVWDDANQEDVDREMVEVILDSGADLSLAPVEYASYGTPCMQSKQNVVRDAQGNQIAVSGEVILTLDLLGPSGDAVEAREKSLLGPVQQPILCLGKFFQNGWRLNQSATSRLALSKEDVAIDVHYKQNSLKACAFIRALTGDDVSVTLVSEFSRVQHREGWHCFESEEFWFPVHYSKSSVQCQIQIWFACLYSRCMAIQDNIVVH